MPHRREDVTFEGEWTQSLNGQQFLLAQDGDHDKIVIFATAENLRVLAASDELYVDGTFHTCPQLFYQIFSIHAIRFRRQFPLAFCLLPNKAQETYQDVFEVLKEKCADLDLQLGPTTVMSDFELAIIHAVELAFPLTTPKGCFFHFCQCLNRKIQALGLQVAYREDAGIRSFVRKTAALAFVPVRFVPLAWQAIKAEAPEHDGIAEFAAYLERTWLVGNYPPVLWNVYETQQTRTNNRLEGWHSKMKKVVGKSPP